MFTQKLLEEHEVAQCSTVSLVKMFPASFMDLLTHPNHSSPPSEGIRGYDAPSICLVVLDKVSFGAILFYLT